MTKEDFCTTVAAMAKALASMPDDLWNGTFPSLVVKYKDGTEIFIGLREAEENGE